MDPRFPTRFVHLEQARRRFGPRVDRMGALFGAGDPPADAAVEALADRSPEQREQLVDQALRGELRSLPAELRTLREALSVLPFWADLDRARHGGEVLLRTGFFGGIVLGFRSLIAGYCSPAGNKPLAFSGRLREAAARRLSETSRFVGLVYQPGSFAPGAPGWVAATRVRLMHAQIRRMLRRSTRWDAAAWGEPINQVDMAGTTLLFSLALVDGLRMLGFRIERDDCEDVLHLWRIGGWILGVEPELLCATEAEARVLWELLETTQEPPDADSAALAAALVEGPLHEARTPEQRARAKRFLPVAYGIGRYLVGDRYADTLGYPKTPWRFAAPALRTLISSTGRLAGRLPGVDRLALEAGIRYWRRAAEAGLGGEDARFELPSRMRHA
ncbi:MAG TPA: oxygenase MpaB family protein [Myxococcaceae bacterium]|nr:oxygenase MpaB family protein [Myxococcaceae bacterium]